MVYIQSNSERTLPHHFDAACAMYGVMESALDFRLTSFEEVESGKFDRLITTNLFVGSVEFMAEVFKRVHRVPSPIMNCDREYQTMTIDDVRNAIESGKEFFVKPFQQKLFTGLVVDKYCMSIFSELEGSLEVMVYDVLPKIVTEWRVYILNNQIMDSRNYCGDFKKSIDYGFVEQKIKEHKKSLPLAYVMDVGVSIDGTNHIIEFNDMYAIGNYGIENGLYFHMLRERYFEIMKSIKE